MTSSLQCLLQYKLLKVQSDEFISATLIVSAIVLQHLPMAILATITATQESIRVACESENVSHVANSDIYKCF